MSCGLLASKRGQRALVTICRDPKLSDRAAGMVLRHMLREMIDEREPTKTDFNRLLQDVVALADEC